MTAACPGSSYIEICAYMKYVLILNVIVRHLCLPDICMRTVSAVLTAKGSRGLYRGPPANGVQGWRQAVRKIVPVTLPNDESQTIIRILYRDHFMGGGLAPAEAIVLIGECRGSQICSEPITAFRLHYCQ